LDHFRRWFEAYSTRFWGGLVNACADKQELPADAGDPVRRAPALGDHQSKLRVVALFRVRGPQFAQYRSTTRSIDHSHWG
jgi:hypothetical protein